MGQEMRDRFCFTVYCALLADNSEADAWNKLLAFNDGFKEPLSLSALKQQMASATERKYRLTNTWVIGELVISEDEQQAIGLYPTSAESARHKAPNYNRDLIRKTVKQDRNNKILAMFSEGISKSQIARELEVSWNTVSRVINDEQARMEALRASQDAEEAALMEEPVAAGAEMQTARKMNEGNTSSKMVLNNIVFYSDPSPALSLSDVQSKKGSGKDPPS
jgi:predicted transcriptional regulator